MVRRIVILILAGASLSILGICLSVADQVQKRGELARLQSDLESVKIRDQRPSDGGSGTGIPQESADGGSPESSDILQSLATRSKVLETVAPLLLKMLAEKTNKEDGKDQVPGAMPGRERRLTRLKALQEEQGRTLERIVSIQEHTAQKINDIVDELEQLKKAIDALDARFKATEVSPPKVNSANFAKPAVSEARVTGHRPPLLTAAFVPALLAAAPVNPETKKDAHSPYTSVHQGYPWIEFVKLMTELAGLSASIVGAVSALFVAQKALAERDAALAKIGAAEPSK